jgi:hypothetical protein
MPADSCRSCGAVSPAGGLTAIWKADKTGALHAVAAQCRGRCARPGTPPPPRRRERGERHGDGRTVLTAYRPGICVTCRDSIIPGETIVRLALNEWAHHSECSREAA